MDRYYYDGRGRVAKVLNSESVKAEIKQIQESSSYTYQEKVEKLNSNGYYYLQVDMHVFGKDKLVRIDVDYGRAEFNISYVGNFSIAYDLKDTIAGWYVSIRNIVIVGMMSVLVYVGIRILISSTSNDKAKYKQFLMDWIVAICLIFIMHYIMSFSVTIVKKITQMFNSVDTKYYTCIVPDKDGKVTKFLTESAGISEDKIDYLYDESNELALDENGDKQIIWSTNTLGVARFNASYAREKNVNYAGYTIMFIILLLITLFFVYTYLKRVLYMAFLTLMAPLVALTYPIDKMNDGKAQAFDMWLKEYIFNLLIQPMHLILYTILVTSAFELASTNIIYSLVALVFMTPAEKLLRKFFGFEKAQTPGMLGGAAGAAITMTALSKGLGRLAHGPKGEHGEKEQKSSNTDDDPSIKYSDTMDSMGSLLGEGNLEEEPENQKDKVLEKYQAEGFGKNTEGHYFNPYTDEYDPDYDPHNDNLMLPTEENKKQTLDEKVADEGNNQRQRFVENANSMNKSDMEKTKRQLFKPSKWRALKAGAKYYAREKINRHAGRKALRFASGLALGGAAGMIGAAAGLVSGDPSKVISNTIAGVSGGYTAGKGIVNTVSRVPGAIGGAIKVEGTAEAAKEAYYGKDEYEQRQIERNIRIAQHDYEIRNELQRTLLQDKDKVERAEREIVPLATRYGMGNAKDISAIAEYMDKTGSSAEESTAIIKEVKSYGKNTSKLGQKEHDDLEKTLRRRIKSKMPNGTEQDIENNATRIRNAMDSASKIYYKS